MLHSICPGPFSLVVTMSIYVCVFVPFWLIVDNTQAVKGWVFSRQIDCINIFWQILSLKGHQNWIIGQNVTVIIMKDKNGFLHHFLSCCCSRLQILKIKSINKKYDSSGEKIIKDIGPRMGIFCSKIALKMPRCKNNCFWSPQLSVDGSRSRSKTLSFCA